MSRPVALDWLDMPLAAPNLEMGLLAQIRQTQLTKLSGSLGYLEEIAIKLVALQNTLHLALSRHI